MPPLYQNMSKLKFKDQLKKQLLVLKLIWLTITATPLSLVLIAYLTTNPDPQANDNLFYVFILVALATTVTAQVIRKYFIKKKTILKFLHHSTEKQIDLNSAEHLSESEKTVLKKSTAIIFIPFVVSLALHESTAILGFTLANFTGNINYCIGFAIVSIYLNLLIYKYPEKLADQIKKAAYQNS